MSFFVAKGSRLSAGAPNRLLAVTAVTTLAIYVLSALSPAIAQDHQVGKVIAVQDGDSITILDPELRLHRIRLAGIDAPEKGQPFGHASHVHLSMLSYDRLATAHCPKIDQYRREVCTVRIDGKDVSLAQLNAGLAWHFKRFAHEQSPEERDSYASAENNARSARSGLWQDDQPIAPWEWRARRKGLTGTQTNTRGR